MDDKLKCEKAKKPWKFIAPKDGEAKSYEMNGSTFHWCGKHGCWCGHSTKECLGVGVNMQFRNNNNKMENQWIVMLQDQLFKSIVR
jgi:hypothetical protein